MARHGAPLNPPGMAAGRRCLAAVLLVLAGLCSALLPATRSLAAEHPRIVTLAPNATELVYAAGAGAYMVAADRSSDYPPAVQSLPRIGDVMQLSDEAILALHPTLVVGWQRSAATESLAARLQDLGTPLIYANPQNLNDLPMLIRDLGKRLGTQATANAAASRLAQRIRALHRPPGPPQTVFIEVSSDPLYTLGDDAITNDLLTRCGARNLYAHSKIAAPQVSVESVLHLNPDVLIISPYGPDTLQARRTWWTQYGLSAARDGHIYAIPADWLHRPGPRIVDAAETLCRDLRNSQTQPHSSAARP